MRFRKYTHGVGNVKHETNYQVGGKKTTNSAENFTEIISFLHLELIVNFVHVQIYCNDKINRLRVLYVF
jgi:hypothetical protein